MRKGLWLVVPVVAVVAAGAVGVGWQVSAWWPRRFGVVEAGRLYRSGSVSPAQLERLCREYGIRRVVSLLNSEAPETRREREAAERRGIEWCNVPLRGDGSSTPEDRRRILSLVADREGGPTLVHCGAGTNRTGLAVGLYRLHEQGWALERVMEELVRFGFEDGPAHENLRRALAEEAAAVAAGLASRPAGGP